MGFAGAAMLAAIVCLVKSFISLFQYFRMIKITRPAIGRIGEPEKKNKFYDDPDMDYESKTYKFYVECDGESYESTYDRRGKDRLQQGMELKVRWSVRDKYYVIPADMIKEALAYLTVSVVCTLIFILCAFIAYMLQ